MNRFVSLLAFLLIIISTSYSQVHTIANGGWHQAAIWSNNQVPDSNTDVIVSHTVDIYNSYGCRNIRIDSTGVLFNGRLDIYGSLLNYGWIDAYRNASSYDGISVRDSIINYGRMDTEVLWLTGDRDHFIRSRDTVRIADMSTTDSNHTIYLGGSVIFKGGYILLRKSNISFTDTLTVVGTEIDGGIINGNGGVLKGAPALVGWSHDISFNPQHTTLKNMTLVGAVSLYGSGTGIWGLTIAENVVNRSDIYDRFLGQPEYEQVYITHPFINYGSFNRAQNGLTVAISAVNLVNYGHWENNTTVFMGLEDQSIALENDSILRGAVHFDAMIQGNAYQWMRNNYNIATAITAKLQFTNLTAADAGIYQCKIITDSGMIYSRQIAVSVPVDVKDGAPVPQKFVLEQNYPNPFNPVTVIRFALPSAGNAGLKIYNSLGEVVAQPVNAYLPAGDHTVNFDATGLTSGVYFYSLYSGGYRIVKKMVLLR